MSFNFMATATIAIVLWEESRIIECLQLFGPVLHLLLPVAQVAQNISTLGHEIGDPVDTGRNWFL